MTDTLAPAPSRSTGSLTLSTGLLAIPVSIYAGVEEVGIVRQEWTADGRRVGRIPAPKNDDGSYGDPLLRSDGSWDTDSIVKRYETVSGALVDLSDDEIGRAAGLPNGTAEVVCFQPLAVMNTGAYVPESIMQVRPPRRADQLTVRAFALLMKAMRIEGTFALVRYCLRGTLAYGALTSSGRLYRLRFDNEVRADLPLPAPSQDFSDDEVMQARALVAALTSTERQPLSNDAAARVAAYAEAKAGGTTEPAAPVSTEAAATSLFDTLRASVAAATAKGE